MTLTRRGAVAFGLSFGLTGCGILPWHRHQSSCCSGRIRNGRFTGSRRRLGWCGPWRTTRAWFSVVLPGEQLYAERQPEARRHDRRDGL